MQQRKPSIKRLLAEERAKHAEERDRHRAKMMNTAAALLGTGMPIDRVQALTDLSKEDLVSLRAPKDEDSSPGEDGGPPSVPAPTSSLSVEASLQPTAAPAPLASAELAAPVRPLIEREAG